MSSILSTQNRHIFLRRKYCFLPITALSPPVGREEPLMGLPPLVSAITTPSPQWIRELLRAGLRVLHDQVSRGRVPPEGRASQGRRSGAAGGALVTSLFALLDFLLLLVDADGDELDDLVGYAHAALDLFH